MANLFVESVIVGIFAVVLAYIVGYITEPLLGVSLPNICARWNKNYVFEINFFLVGFFANMAYRGFGFDKMIEAKMAS